jgi:hypothetical protein
MLWNDSWTVRTWCRQWLAIVPNILYRIKCRNQTTWQIPSNVTSYCHNVSVPNKRKRYTTTRCLQWRSVSHKQICVNHFAIRKEDKVACIIRWHDTTYHIYGIIWCELDCCKLERNWLWLNWWIKFQTFSYKWKFLFFEKINVSSIGFEVIHCGCALIVVVLCLFWL